MARIVVDAMGSDDFPKPDVEGSVKAAREYGVEIILVGDESKIKPVLDSQNPGRLPIRNRPRARDADHGRQRRSADIQSAAWTKFHGGGHGPRQEG